MVIKLFISLFLSLSAQRAMSAFSIPLSDRMFFSKCTEVTFTIAKLKF